MRAGLDEPDGPGAHDRALRGSQDRFAILDRSRAPTRPRSPSSVPLLGSDGGFAALYYPRIVVRQPNRSGRITISPSGHLDGLTRTDDDRGSVQGTGQRDPLRRAGPRVHTRESPIRDRSTNKASTSYAASRTRRGRVGCAHDLDEHAVAITCDAGCCCSSRSPASAAPSSWSSSRTSRPVGEGQARSDRLPDPAVDGRSARRRHTDQGSAFASTLSSTRVRRGAGDSSSRWSFFEHLRPSTSCSNHPATGGPVVQESASRPRYRRTQRGRTKWRAATEWILTVTSTFGSRSTASSRRLRRAQWLRLDEGAHRVSRRAWTAQP